MLIKGRIQLSSGMLIELCCCTRDGWTDQATMAILAAKIENGETNLLQQPEWQS